MQVHVFEDGNAPMTETSVIARHETADPSAGSQQPVLISHPLCPYVQRAVIVLTEKQVAFQRIDIDLAAKPDWFLRLSPLGRVPLLRIGETALFESQVIAEYLDEITPGSLHPADPLEKARCRSWIEAASATLDAIARLYNAPDQTTFEAAAKAVEDRVARIEPEIAGPFFAGETFHLVDGVWGTVFRYFDVFESEAGLDLLGGAPRVRSWRAAVMARPSVQSAAPPDYPERLRAFLARRGSEISRRLSPQDA